MIVKYLCGCIVEATSPENMRHDQEGFLICADHRVRRRGWKSLPVRNGRTDYRFAGFTPLEIEKNLIFKVPLGQGQLELK